MAASEELCKQTKTTSEPDIAGSLTEAERAALEGIGWRPGMSLPKNAHDILQQSSEVIVSGQPNTNPVLQKLQQAKQQEQQQEKENQELAEMEARFAAIPGLREAYMMAREATKKQQVEQEPKLVVVDDRPQKEKPQKEETPTTQQPKEQTEEPVYSVTGAAVQPTHCPHCQWDLSQRETVQPTYVDKITFVQAILGNKPFVRDYELFGGEAVVTFRTLTPEEIDTIYRQAWIDRKEERIVTEIDYWERINRYRLFLQLLKIKMKTSGQIHTLPDGLSKETNNQASDTWSMRDIDRPLANETILPCVESYIVKNVLRNEILFRTVNVASNQFNRLVAKLEAMADNPDFWNPTKA